jgi:hypothetical protein
MNCRIPCSVLFFVVGCSDPAGPGVDDSGAQTTAGEQTSATAQTTADAESGGTAPTTAGDTGDTGDTAGTGGSASASQSGSGSATDSDVTSGTSGSTGDTSTGECGSQDGPAPVELGGADDLGAPGAYVVLAKAAIPNVPGSKIVGGNVGISPAAGSAITGFSLALDPTGVYATSSELPAPGRVYAADYVVPTPINLTTAVLAMQLAYTDAASRVPTDHLNLESGDIGGLTLAPGVYTWGTTVLVADDVTLAGCEDDVWILQISGDLDISTGKRVLLAGGAQARNVFWQIAGGATIHANAHIEGVVLAKTEITLQTGASMHGRAFAQTMIALDANAVTAP